MPPIGMLLCKAHSNDPPTSAASAHPPPTEPPSTSKNPQTTAFGPASSDDGPPPPKSRRQTTLAINAARRHGTPLEAEHVSMSRKQSKRAYNEVSSTDAGKAGSSRSSKKRAPLADVTNSAAVPTAASTRPKRAATKRLDPGWCDSASDGGSSSSSEFHPDADHVSEDEMDVGEHTNLDACDLDVGVTPSDTGEPSAEPQSTIGNEVETPAVNRANSLQKIGIGELRNHMANISQNWKRESKLFRCHVCRFDVKAVTLRRAGEHLVRHLGDKALFPYFCPSDNCDFATTELSHITRHVKTVHKLKWTNKLEASSVHEKNKARLDALYCGTLRRQTPSLIHHHEYEPDNKRVSENDYEPDAGHVNESHEDENAYVVSSSHGKNQSVYAASSNSSELPNNRNETGRDSAQITVDFNVKPPYIPCSKPVPKLKFFHELSDAELRVFEEAVADIIKCYCHFCQNEPSDRGKIEQDTGVSGMAAHFWGTGECYFKCTWPGCTKCYSTFVALRDHYGCAHDPSLSRWKCKSCNHVAWARSSFLAHENHPHPSDRSEALRTWSVRNSVKVKWEDPRFCDKCGTWYAGFNWLIHKAKHDNEDREFDCTRAVQDGAVTLSGIRDGTCPFSGCPYPYGDFTGWYLHCMAEHSVYITTGGNVPCSLTCEQRAQLPSFRCSTCKAIVGIGHVQRHAVRCIAALLPETVGALMRQRSEAYGVQPGLLELEYGVRVLPERHLMGVLKETLDPHASQQLLDDRLRAIRSDPFLSSFIKRNQGAPKNSTLYVVFKLRNDIVPGLLEWVKDAPLYVGQTTSFASRAARHHKDSITHWYYMGLRLEEGEDLFMIRVSVTVDEHTSVSSFYEADLRRLEQLLIDSLGIGTLYNEDQVLAPETMMNDATYRNHLAPRLTQLALVLFESTHKRLVTNGIKRDQKSGNVRKLPLTRHELARLVKTKPCVRLEAPVDSAKQISATVRGVDQACSPIPFPRILSPEVHDVLSRFQAERGFTDEEMADWVLTRKARASTSSGHDEHLETNQASLPPAVSVQPDALAERPVSSPDMFAYLYSEEPEEETPAVYDSFDHTDVPTTSNGPDLHALDELRASTAYASSFNRASTPAPDHPHMPAGKSVQSGLSRQLSPDPSDSPLRSEGSATKASPVKRASGFLTPLVIGNHTMRIPRYGHRCTQYVDLDREPVALTQDSSSEASLDEKPQQELVDASSESSDEEPLQDFLDDSSESSLDEPSPTDSGIDNRFDFEKYVNCGRQDPGCNVLSVPVTGADPNIKDSSDENTPKKPAPTAKAATSSVDDDKEDAVDSDLYDKCAHKNCRRPQYENINWVQCDDCNVWYHNLCILGVDNEFEEDEFRCGCAENGKRKPDQARDSK